MLAQKVICPTCTNFKFVVIKKSRQDMSSQLMTNGTSNIVLASSCLNACFKKNQRRETKEAGLLLSGTSRTIPTSRTVKQGSQLHPIATLLSRPVSCIKVDQQRSYNCRPSIPIRTMTVIMTRVQLGREGEHDSSCLRYLSYSDKLDADVKLVGFAKVQSSVRGRLRIRTAQRPTALPSPTLLLQRRTMKVPN